MPYATLEEDQIKDLVKQAMFELLQEQRDWFSDIIAEVIEEFALEKAIKEGESTETIDRNEVMEALEGTT